MDKHKLDNTLLIRLTKGQKNIYDAFYKAMKNGQYEVILPTAINRDNIIYYLKLVIAENPELCEYDTCNCKYSMYGHKCIVHLERAFRKRTMRFDLERKASEILQPILNNRVSDIKKVLYVHDYLIKHITYRERSLDCLSHSAYGAIVNNEAVCEGISYGFSYLLKKLGIKATVVDGKADGEAHAWNIVEIGSERFHFDVTWDLLRQNDNHDMIYDYFCLSDSDLKDRIWDRKIYPICNSRTYNYFLLSNSFAHNEKELIKIIERQFPKYRAIYFKYDFIPWDKEKSMAYIWNAFKTTVQKNGWHYKSVIYSLNEDQKIFSLHENTDTIS